MSGSNNNENVARRFADLWHAIHACEKPHDIIDSLRDAIDRKVEHLASAQPVFISGSFTVETVAYETDTTQILKVRHRDLGTSFAIKTLPAAQHGNPVLTRRLRREAEIGVALRHPCLQEISTLLRLPDGRPGLLQSWTPASLASILSSGTVNRENIISLLTRTLNALAALHNEGYVHCDVSPANILLPDGLIEKARLGDFGITLEIGETHAGIGVALAGSPEYAAPEQMAGGPAHPCHDIYAIGRLTQRLLDAASFDDCPALKRFSDACTAENASSRPQSAEAALQLLTTG